MCLLATTFSWLVFETDLKAQDWRVCDRSTRKTPSRYTQKKHCVYVLWGLHFLFLQKDLDQPPSIYFGASISLCRFLRRTVTLGSIMELVYLTTWMVDLYGKSRLNVGTYTKCIDKYLSRPERNRPWKKSSQDFVGSQNRKRTHEWWGSLWSVHHVRDGCFEWFYMIDKWII